VPVCFCGCGRRGVQKHHAVYAQHLRRTEKKDRRNLVPVAVDCHSAHHQRRRPFRLAALPDSVYEFAEEILGVGPAYEYLRRRYAGADARLDGLLVRCEADDPVHVDGNDTPPAADVRGLR
jgi:hypothetical protein